MFKGFVRSWVGLCLLWGLSSLLFPADRVRAATTPATVAYVYVGTPQGINLYNAAANGKLTLVAGSPFKTTGLMIGSNQKYFISLGTDWVHAYPVATNGAIGAQVSQINTQNYSGYVCGTTNGAVLDHTGQYLYVLLNVPPANASPECDAFQTFKIASNGLLTFVGATTTETGAPPQRNLPTILANEKWAFAVNDFYQPAQDIYLTGWSGFQRASNGMLEYRGGYFWNDPGTENDEDYIWFPLLVTADPTNHLAAVLHNWFDPPYGVTGGPQLASYTVDTNGIMSSTNVWAQMPYTDFFPTVINMSPDGKLLAVGASDGGLEVFHFNGAAEITRYSKVLTTDGIVSIHWDKANHLYAVSPAGKLYVYTITPTSITAAPGSPYAVNKPDALFVVPR